MKTLGTLLAAVLILAAVAPAQIPVVGWEHWDAGTSVAPHVSVGDLGGQVFAHFGAPCCADTAGVLLVAQDGGVAGPVVWSVNTHREVPWDSASAETDDVYVSIVTREPSPPGPYRVWVHRWSSASELPTWSRQLGSALPSTPLGWAPGRPRIGCTADGSRVVAMIGKPGTGGRHDVVVLDGATGAQLSSVEVMPPAEPAPQLTAFDLAEGGAVAAWRLGRGGYVLDLASGTLLLALDDGGGEFIGGSIAVSADGNVVALVDRTPGKVRLYERAGPGEAYQLTHVHQGPAEAGSVSIEVSADGSVVAIGHGGFNFPGNVIWVQALDVASRSLTMSDARILPNVGYGVSDIAISSDGQRFVVGLIGGIDADADRVLLYAPDQDDPLWSAVGNVGSVRDVDISGDGRVAVAGGNTFDGPGADVWLLPVEASADFVVSGALALGGQVTFSVAGAPGRQAFLLVAAAPAVPPLVFGGGVLYLDPASLLVLPMGSVAADGAAHLTAAVPDDGLLLGVEIWTQGGLAPGDQLSAAWRKLTVLPMDGAAL